ncbi:hypothetical protein AKO1_015414 [Acrasis kona]|uniref:DOCKER domain-containing protein n=1 Tax=Acrasis kona TaxID=1008807 RepID=A0AAW2YJY2_9EUKA
MITLALSRSLQGDRIRRGDDFHLRQAIKSMCAFAEKDIHSGQLTHRRMTPSSPSTNHLPSQPVNGNNQQQLEKKIDFKSTLAMFRSIEAENVKHAKINHAASNPINHNQFVIDISNRLQTLLNDTIATFEISQGADDHKIEDLFHRISISYAKIPELRFMWLRQLANNHEQNARFAESALCHVHILHYAFELLKDDLLKNTSIHTTFHDTFGRLVSSNNNNNQQNQSTTMDSYDISGGHLPELTLPGILELIKICINQFEMAECYEWSVTLNKILVILLEIMDDHKQLSDAYLHLHKLYKITQFNKNSKLYPNYYRVAFLGNWGDSDLKNKQFVYKTPKLFKLFKMKEKIKTWYGHDVQVISNVKAIIQDEHSKYVHLTHVKPYICTNQQSDQNDFVSRSSEFQKHVNLNQFYYETAYSMNAKKLSDKVSEIYKRKVIVHVDGFFPNAKSRLQIIKEDEMILTPIEAATENMTEQISRLQDVCSIHPPDVAQLQMVLQGSVRATVNNGPKDIVNSFLREENRGKFNVQHVVKLNQKCLLFLYWCEKAVQLHAEHKRHDQTVFHIELEKGYEKVRELFEECLLFDEELATLNAQVSQ